MLISQFLEDSWTDYVNQVKIMSVEDKAEIAADFEDSGMSDAMTFIDEEEITAEGTLAAFKFAQADMSEEQIKLFAAKLTEKYWTTE